MIEVLSKNHPTLFDLLIDIKQNTKLTKTVLDKFIKVGAFQSYCKGLKASKYMNLFMNFYTPKMAKVEKELLIKNYLILKSLNF